MHDVRSLHAGIMAVQALTSPGQHSHLIGDVPALFIIAFVLAVLTPRAEKVRTDEQPRAPIDHIPQFAG